MRPIDTQCLIFTAGRAVVVAFRGSQPVNFFDWFYNLSVNSLPKDGNKATIEPVTPSSPGG